MYRTYSIRCAICISDEKSVDLVERNPEKANAITSAINEANTNELVELLKEVDQKNPIISDSTSAALPYTVLHFIAFRGILEMFQTVSNTLTDLQPKSKSVRDNGITPLHYAAQQGHLPIVRFITDCIKDINPTDAAGKTVLQYAAEEGQLNVVKFYVENLKKDNRDINPSSRGGETPLYVAAKKGYSEIIKFYVRVIKYQIVIANLYF